MLLRGRLPAMLALALAWGAVRAQTTSSALSGSVHTPGGEPLADAVVQARSDATGVVRFVTTDERGRYRIDLLTPGSWWVSVQTPAGKPTPPKIVKLGLQQTLDVDFEIQPEMTESVTVQAEAPVLDAQRTGGELRVGGQLVENLPVSSGVVWDLALLDSSVKPVATGGGEFYGERGAVFVVNGQSGRSNSFLVDGLDNNDQISGTSMNSYFSQSVIREFVVLTNQFSAEFGRASGGLLNIITEQGNNTPTGEFFLQGASHNWNAPGDFVGSLPQQPGLQDSSDNYLTGFKMGGPFKKDQAFGFLSYERQRGNQVIPYAALQRDGTYGGWMVGPSKGDSLFLRGDFNLNASNFLMVRLSGDKRRTDGINVGGIRAPESGFDLEEQDWQLAATLNTVLSPKTINEARLLIGGSEFDQYARSLRSGIERPSGVDGGSPLSLQLRDEARLQLIDNVTFSVDGHMFKFGVDFTRSRARAATSFDPYGGFLYNTDKPFNPGDCGDIIFSQIDPDDPYAPIPCTVPGADANGNGIPNEPGMIGTYPVVFSWIKGAPKVRLDDTKITAFAQDSWDIRHDLRLDFGLRYDVSTFHLPADLRIPSVIPNGGAGIDSNDIAPRFAFAWTPFDDGRLVVRGGAGIFYDKIVLAFPAVSAVTSQMEVLTYFPQALTVELTEDMVRKFVDMGILEQVLVFPKKYMMFFSTATTLDTPYSRQISLGAELATGRRSSVHAEVVSALGYHQPLMRDLNYVVRVKDRNTPFATPVHLDESLGVPEDQLVGSIAALVTEGRSWYNGLTVGWRTQGAAGGFSASYTLSRSEDLGPDPLKGGLGLPPQSIDLDLEKGRSDTDRRHRLTLYGEAPLPWLGLRIATIIQAASGAPFNVTTGKDDNLDGVTSDRPVGVGRNSGAGTSLLPVNNLRIKEGLPLVTSLEEPYFLQVDLRVHWPWGDKGRWNGDFYLQMYNLFDRENTGLVQGRVISKDFGKTIALASPPRTLEIGVRAGF
jgi:hypothetical protein